MGQLQLFSSTRIMAYLYLKVSVAVINWITGTHWNTYIKENSSLTMPHYKRRYTYAYSVALLDR